MTSLAVNQTRLLRSIHLDEMTPTNLSEPSEGRLSLYPCFIEMPETDFFGHILNCFEWSIHEAINLEHFRFLRTLNEEHIAEISGHIRSLSDSNYSSDLDGLRKDLQKTLLNTTNLTGPYYPTTGVENRLASSIEILFLKIQKLKRPPNSELSPLVAARRRLSRALYGNLWLVEDLFAAKFGDAHSGKFDMFLTENILSYDQLFRLMRGGKSSYEDSLDIESFKRNYRRFKQKHREAVALPDNPSQ